MLLEGGQTDAEFTRSLHLWQVHPVYKRLPGNTLDVRCMCAFCSRRAPGNPRGDLLLATVIDEGVEFAYMLQKKSRHSASLADQCCEGKRTKSLKSGSESAGDPVPE